MASPSPGRYLLRRRVRHLCGLDAFGLDEDAAAKVARLDRLLEAGGDDAVRVGLWHLEQALATRGG